MTYSADSTHNLDLPRTTIDNQTWVSKPTAAQFGIGQAFFSDIAAMGYSDGTSWFVNESLLAQFAMPLILPSSGTIGNNGALSAITALNTTYAECYMYFPVNTIAAGVPAGWYYTVMSSTTAGTIYNNTYTSGTPATPEVLTPFVTTGPGLYTQTITPVVGVTIPISGFMEANSSLDVWVDQGCNNSVGVKTINVNLDTTILHNLGVTTSLGQPHRVIIQNRGSKARQKVTRANVASEALVPSVATMFTTVNTATVENLVIEFDLSAATDFVTLEGLIVKLST